ncbi:hypothetical protein EBZ80_26790, partial [bacterium]|nr:hypothetical protein [bacterium]
VVNGLSFDPVATHLNLGMSQKYTARENGSASGFTYSVQPLAMGVTINDSTGALSVASTARRGIYTVKATKGAKSVMSMLVVLQNVKPGSGNDRPFALKLGEFKQFPSFTFPGVNPNLTGFWQNTEIFPPRTGLTEYPVDRLDQSRVIRAASGESLAGRYVNILKYGRNKDQPGYDPTEEDIILPFKILRADGSDPSIARAEAEPRPLPTPGVQAPARIVAQPVPPPMPGESAWVPGGRFKCAQPYPGPANLRMYVDKDNQVILNWQDLGGEVSYEVRTCQKETCGAADWSLVQYERFYPGVSSLDATGQFAIGGYYRYMPEFFGDYKKLTSSILRARVRAVSGAGPYKDYNCIGRYSAEAVLLGPSPHMNPTVTEVIPGSSSIKVKLTPPARATHERYPVCAFEYQVEETPVAGANSRICRAKPTFDYRGNATCPDDTGLRGNGDGGVNWWYRGYQRLACPNGNSPLPEFLEIPFTESQL